MATSPVLKTAINKMNDTLRSSMLAAFAHASLKHQNQGEQKRDSNISAEKPRVFIGSSLEALPIANRVRNILSKEFGFNVCLWSDDFFGSNEFTLQALLQKAPSFDFSVIILSLDDPIESRDEKGWGPRDNTLLEFGLFLGKLGQERAFALIEKDAKKPSDLSGLTIESFNRTANDTEYASLTLRTRKLAADMKERWESGIFGMLPSTILAINYFDHFLKGIAGEIFRKTPAILDGEQITLKKLYVVFPETLDDDMTAQSAVYRKTKDLHEIHYSLGHREGPLYVKKHEAKSAIGFDLPTTLGGIRKVIKLHLGIVQPMNSDEQLFLEKHELRNFRRILQNRINNDSYAREHIEIINESDPIENLN